MRLQQCVMITIGMVWLCTASIKLKNCKILSLLQVFYGCALYIIPAVTEEHGRNVVSAPIKLIFHYQLPAKILF